MFWQWNVNQHEDENYDTSYTSVSVIPETPVEEDVEEREQENEKDDDERR